MITLEELEKEFDEKYSKSPNKLVFKIHIGGFVNSDYVLKEAIDNVKEFYQAKINQVIDEMIGEEKTRKEGLTDWSKSRLPDHAYRDGQNIGYNQKRDELIQFKKEFNK